MRILFLTHQLTLTGAPSVGLGVLKQRPAGVDVMTVAERGGSVETDWRAVGALTVLDRSIMPPPTASSRLLIEYGVERFVAPRIRSAFAKSAVAAWRPDLVYANSVASLPLLANLAPSGVPVIVHVHEVETLLADHVRRSPSTFASRPTKYIAVTEFAKRCSIDHGANPAAITVIPPFYDQSKFPSPATPVERDRNRPIHIGGVGNDYWRKGITLWLLMAADLAAKFGRGAIKFTWIGTTSFYGGERPDEMVRKLGLSDVVELLPSTPDIARFMSTFDVLAVTSWEESASIVTMESMALGVPVACFAGSGGPPEIAGDAGCIVDDFSPAKMADAIAKLIASDTEYAATQVRSIARARSLYTSAVVVPQIWQVIESVVGPRAQ